MAKPKPERVKGAWARQALAAAHGDRKAAYSRYILLAYATTGRLACGIDNRDLQAWYETDREGAE